MKRTIIDDDAVDDDDNTDETVKICQSLLKVKRSSVA